MHLATRTAYLPYMTLSSKGLNELKGTTRGCKRFASFLKLVLTKIILRGMPEEMIKLAHEIGHFEVKKSAQVAGQKLNQKKRM